MARLTPAATESAVQRQTRKNSTQKKYKVVFESVTSKQKKLHTVIKFGAKPPPGYTFIPAGIPELTQRCKNGSRAGNYKIFVVSTSGTATNQITQHVNRIGYHFVSSVAERACRALGLNVHTLRPYLFNGKSRHNNLPRGAPTTADSTPQEVLDAQAHDHLNDLFPGCPDEDKLMIITRAFKKGVQTVGNVAELSVARRVQLAVVAHIRHVHTDYDKLLRSHGYLRAREMVHKGCVEKLLEWRGDEEGEDEVNEFFREVIYIPDSDEEGEDDGGEDDQAGEDENEEDDHPASDSEASVEIIAVQTVARELHDHDPEQGKGADGADGMLGESGANDDSHDQPYIQDQSTPNRRIYATQAAVPTARRPPRRTDRRRRWKNRRDLQRYDAVRESQEKNSVTEGLALPTQQPITPIRRDGVIDLISPRRDSRQQQHVYPDLTRPSAIQADPMPNSLGWPVDEGTSRAATLTDDPGAALTSDRVLCSRTVMANVSSYRADDRRHKPTSGRPFSPAMRLEWLPQSTVASSMSVPPPYTLSSKPQHPNAEEQRRLLIPAESDSLRNPAAPSRHPLGVEAQHLRSDENRRGVVMPSIESPVDGVSSQPYGPYLDEPQSLEVLPNGRGKQAPQTAAVNPSQRLAEARFDESHQLPEDLQRKAWSTMPIRERPDGRFYRIYGETEVLMENRRVEQPTSSLGRAETRRAPSAALQSSVGPNKRLVPVSPETERFLLSQSREAPPSLVRSSMSHRDFFDGLSSRDARAAAPRARISGDSFFVSREAGQLRYESGREPRATRLSYSVGSSPRGDDNHNPEGAPEQSIRYPTVAREPPILGLDRATVARDRNTARLVPLRGHVPDPLMGRFPERRVPVEMPAPKRPGYRSSDHFGPGTEGYRPSDVARRPDPAECHHEMFYPTSAGPSASRRMSYPDYMTARDPNQRLPSVRPAEPQGKMPHQVRELSPVPDRRRDPHRVRQYSLVYDDDATRRFSRAPYGDNRPQKAGLYAPRPSDEIIVLE